jgi:hypothetical protein
MFEGPGVCRMSELEDRGRGAIPATRRACWRSAHRREPAVCTDQRCSKCSPGVSDTQGAPVCREGVYVDGVLQ